VIGMPGHIHMGVMTVRRLILHMGDRDRDPPRLLLGRLINLIERRETVVARIRLSKHLGDGRRECGLAMVDMTHRPDIQMMLRPFELLLGHLSSDSFVANVW